MSDICITGGCQCGAVRYSLTSPSLLIYACHCSVCRRVSTSIFNISCIVDEDSITVERGDLSRVDWVVGSGVKRLVNSVLTVVCESDTEMIRPMGSMRSIHCATQREIVV